MNYFHKGKLYFFPVIICIVLSFFGVESAFSENEQAKGSSSNTVDKSPVEKLLEAENMTVLAAELANEAKKADDVALALNAARKADNALKLLSEVIAFAEANKKKAMLNKANQLKKKNELTLAQASAILGKDRYPEEYREFDLPVIEEPPVKDLNPAKDLTPASPV